MSATYANKVVVAGFGSEYRHDDGVGPIVAERAVAEMPLSNYVGPLSDPRTAPQTASSPRPTTDGPGASSSATSRSSTPCTSPNASSRAPTSSPPSPRAATSQTPGPTASDRQRRRQDRMKGTPERPPRLGRNR